MILSIKSFLEHVGLLTYFIQNEFKYFIRQLRDKLNEGQLNSIFCALLIEKMALTLRPLGACCPSPLAYSIDNVSRLNYEFYFLLIV
jgi:hypothetical protein